MTRRARTIIIIFSVVALVVFGALYFLKSFFSAFAPPKVIVTKEFIATNQDFINGVSIEKILVDSIGQEGYPLKYTTIYTTSCNIHHPTNKPPKPPSKIEFNKPGKYSWVEDTVKIRYVHSGLRRQSLDTTNKLWWLDRFGKHAVCPLKLEQGQWYFITIGDPQMTGIFFYIDSSGKERQHFLPSGVSPI